MTDLSPTQFARLQQAYLALADVPHAERTAKARELLGDDPVLMAEFEALPHSDHIPTAFLEPVQPPGVSVWKGSAPIGPAVGRFRLLTLLGEGGFGMVYEAEQSEPVRRRVALKVIKPGMDSRAVLNRFEAERQALALMDHPYIARVYDGGTTGAESGHPGLPYFVMELVRGDAITTFCDRERLTIERRIELMIQVCEAVQHAHLKGIIHRDIKPSNVLVSYQDGKPTPKVIDFGVAKAVGHGLTEHTLFTHRGQLVGTPAYMSPEQAEMSGVDVDSRTDVYSLGVLLYEVLTSRPPFDPETLRSAGYAEMVRIIREVEPPRPSTRLNTLLRTREGDDTAVAIAKARRAELSALTRRLRTDLDWVVMKCLQKERDHRYTTARELADELRRILSHEPVRAGPPRVAYRARKFARRHRTSLAWSAALLVVAAGGSGAGYLAWHASAEAAALRTQLIERARSGDFAVNPVEFVQMDADAWEQAAIEAYEQVSGAIGQAADARYAQLTESARNLLQMPDPTSADLRVRMSRVLLVQGDALASLRRSGPRELALAEKCFRRILSILPAQPGAETTRADLAILKSRAHAGLGDVLRNSDVAASRGEYQHALDAFADVRVELADDEVEFERARSRARRDAAIALARMCAIDDAEKLALDVVQEREHALEVSKDDVRAQIRAQRDLTVSLITLAEVRGLANRPSQATQSARAALAMRTTLLEQVVALSQNTSGDVSNEVADWARRNRGTFDRDVPVARIILADNLTAMSDWDGAADELEQANQELTALLEQNPDDARLRSTLLECVLGRAELAAATGDGASVLPAVSRGWQVAAGLPAGFERDELASCRLNLLFGIGLRLSGQARPAIESLREAARCARQISTRDGERVEYIRLEGRALVELGRAMVDTGDLPGAGHFAAEAEHLYSKLGDRACGMAAEELNAPRALLTRIDSLVP